MSIKLQLQNANFDVKPDEQLQLQFIPASIANNAPANINNYFNNYTEESDDGSMFFTIISLYFYSFIWFIFVLF